MKYVLAAVFILNCLCVNAQKKDNKTNDALKTLLANKGFEQVVVKALGADAPLRLDQDASLPQYTSDINGFKPVMIKSIADIDRALPPGDYSLDVMFYCTQWSIHRPGSGLPYKLGRAQGRLAKQMTAMLYRGTMKHINPHTLNTMAWRIQGGVQLQNWSAAEQKLVHELIPEYEKDLKGDYVQQIENHYNTLVKPQTKKTFDAQLLAMGDVGKTFINLLNSRKLLADKAIANDKLPGRLYDQNNDGTPLQLPDEKGAPPSPWMIVNPKVIARFTVQQGNMGHNLFEFRVLQDALAESKSEKKINLFKKKKSSEESSVNTYETITLNKIFNGAGDDEGRGLIGYSMLRPAQAPEVQPVLGDEPPFNQGGQTFDFEKFIQDERDKPYAWCMPMNECYTRAYQICDDLGDKCEKLVWIYTENKVEGFFPRIKGVNLINRYNGNPINIKDEGKLDPVHWWFHVAPLVNINNKNMVIDPLLSPGKPIDVFTWKQYVIGKDEKNVSYPENKTILKEISKDESPLWIFREIVHDGIQVPNWLEIKAGATYLGFLNSIYCY